MDDDDLKQILLGVFDVLADDPLLSTEASDYLWALEAFRREEREFKALLRENLEAVRVELNRKYEYVLPEGFTFEWEAAE